MSKSPATKIDMVAHHLVTKKKITSWEAIQRYRATRLADIIFTLKNEGWDIITKMMKKDGVQYAEYRLISYPRTNCKCRV